MASEKSNVEIIKIKRVVDEVFGTHLHHKQSESLGYAALALLNSESLILHRLGEGLAKARGVQKKHATKQIDRLLSNKKLDVWNLSLQWAQYVIGDVGELMVALDWSAFADDKQSMLSLNLVSSKGLSMPLLWKSVENERIKHNRARYEDQLLSCLRTIVKPHVKVMVLADRGFSDHKFLRFLSEELKFDYIVRIKSNTTIITPKEALKAGSRLEKGRIITLKNVGVTLQNYKVSTFVATQDKGMKAPWYLVSNIVQPGSKLIQYYSKRWKIEPYFRDLKDGRFGYGLEQTHYRTAQRRDRLMLIVVLCYRLLVILGQAGEQIGFDKKLKVNTVKKRTHSLFTQGRFYYEFYPHFTTEEQYRLTSQFSDLLQQETFWKQLFETATLEGTG